MHLACRRVDSPLFHVVGNFECTLQIIILKFNRWILRKWECVLGETYISKLLSVFFLLLIYGIWRYLSKTFFPTEREINSDCLVWLKKKCSGSLTEFLVLF